jgi:hypothetical protein
MPERTLTSNNWNLARSIAFIVLIGSALPQMNGVFAKESQSTEQASLPTNKSSSGRCETQLGSTILGCGIFPSDDTFTDNLLPTKIMQEEISSVLIVQNTPSVPVSRNYAFLRFNLTSVLPRGILTSHAKPLNASLWLYSRFVNNFRNASVSVYRVPTNDWNESALTWENMPSLDTSHFETQQITTANAWYRWNVTDDVGSSLQTSGTVSFALIASDRSWKNYAWFDSKEPLHPQNVSTTPELDLYFREPALTLIAPFSHLSVTLDNRTLETGANGTLQVGLPWGVHQVSVPQVIAEGNGMREFLVGWSDNVSSAAREINIGNDQTIGIDYRRQYYLNVTSPYATTGGSGWYFSGETANATVQPTVLFHEGLLGVLGVRRVFDRWAGNCSSIQPECVLTMTGPMQATATWKDDYAITVVIFAVVAIGAALAMLLRKKLGERKRRGSNYDHTITSIPTLASFSTDSSF